jgi:hypothetical protein
MPKKKTFSTLAPGDEPNTSGTILPYPFGGIFYNSEDDDAPILFGVFNGSQDIRLTMPEQLVTSLSKTFFFLRG